MKYILMVLFCLSLFEGKAQIMYKTRYENSIFIESGAISPIFSVNYGKILVRWQRSFLASSIGLGYLPGRNGFTDTGVSLPLSATYNFMPGSFKKRLRINASRCNPDPPKIQSETFIETGLAYTYKQYFNKESGYYGFGIIGLRTQVIFNIPPKFRIVYLRAMFTPAITPEKKFEARGGFSLGVAI